MENLNGTLKLSGNLTGDEIPVIIKEKTIVEKNYENLDNKPSINDVILEGNKTPAELGLTKASDFEMYKQSVDHSFRGVSESIRSVKTESKTYTDNAMEATKAYSDGKNSDLETAINETINTKNNGTRAYASHLVSEESDARKTADEETLAASKSYTDTAVIKEVTKGPASSLEFEGLQEGIPFPKIILTVPDEYVYEEGKTAHSINICCNNYADPDATEPYAENMLVVAKSNTVEIGYDDTIKLLKQVPGKCVVGFMNEEDAAVCTLTVTGALKYEALKRIYSECWNRMDVEKDDMEGYVRGYTDTEITKCKEYTDEKIAEVGDITAKGNPVQLDGLQGGVPFSEMVVSGDNIIGQDLTVNVSGKNLLKYPYVNTTKTVNGITFTDNGDGSIIANGTSTAQAWFTIFNNVTFNRGTYTLSGNQSGGKLKYDTNLIWKDNNGNEHWVVDAGDGITFTLPYQVTVKILLRIYNGITVENIVFRPQLEIGTEATEYEPYHGASYTITPDSNPYTIPNDIRQVDGLNNISVSEGEISVVGVRKNAALKRVWNEMNDFNVKIGNINTILESVTGGAE